MQLPLALRIALFIATLIYIIIVIKAVKNKRMHISFSIFWLFTSLILIVAILAPTFVQKISNFLGFKVTSNMIYFIAIFLSFYLIFNLNILFSKEHRKNTLLIQEISLLKKEVEDIKNGK